MDEWGLPRTIPIAGTWTVTYGAPARVEITGSSGYYTIRAVTRIQLKQSRYSLPAGTVLGQVRQSGLNSYSGEHGLWFIATGQFARWAPMSLTTFGGSQLSGTITNERAEPIVFTRVSPVSTGPW